MEQASQEKMKISKGLLDSMLVGVKTQEDLWGQDGIITQLNKALLERILDAEMDFHLENDQDGRAAGILMELRKAHRENDAEMFHAYGWLKDIIK